MAMNGHINKTELIRKLCKLEGLTDEERNQLIALLQTHKKYGLVWEEKKENVEERLRDEQPVFQEVKDKFIPSDTPEAPNHILIEGDNLEALTALSYTHEGKIDVIYIDPPYNTGNKDFVYNDSFVDSEDCYKHSKWLSFMNKRLKIAKRLLSDKGVIFISIDDNEQAQLKMLCDGIFGVDHFICNFIWKSRQNKDNRNISGVSIDHEYIICYCKTMGIRSFIGAERKMDNYSNPDNDPRGPWTSANMAGLATEAARPNLHYDLIDPNTGINYGRPQKGWRYDRNTMASLIADNRILWPETPKGRPRKKSFLSEISDILPGYASIVGKDVYTRTATVEQNDIFGNALFGFPKPVFLVQELISQTSNKSSTILDFFAGSGTTLHATMQLNSEDGGHRQCILVTNNENGICEKVTYERNKRVIQGYTTPKGIEVEGLHHNNLRYYRTAFISRDRTQKNMRSLVNAATDLLCIKEDLYKEQSAFGPLRLQPSLVRYFTDGIHHMLVVYHEELIDQLVEAIKQMDFGRERLKVYVFSPGRYAFDDNFYEVSDKVLLVALPAAIYDAYQKVLPRRRPQPLTLESSNPAIPTDLFAGQEGFEKGGGL